MASPWKSASSIWSSAATISSTASAPMARASATSCAETVKSLRRMGRSIAERTAARSSGDPPKKAWSVRTEHAAAPPSA